MGEGSLGTEVSVPLSLISNQSGGRGSVHSASDDVVEGATVTSFPVLQQQREALKQSGGHDVSDVIAEMKVDTAGCASSSMVASLSVSSVCRV